MTEIINARRHPLVLKIVGPYVATFSTCIIFITGFCSSAMGKK